MADTAFQSPRTFSVFRYEMSHGLLLLRSGKTNDHATRIDLLLQDVRAMELRMWFTSIVIKETDVGYLKSFQSNPEEMIEPGNKVYAVQGDGWNGFVVGGSLSVHEDDGEMIGPSALPR